MIYYAIITESNKFYVGGTNAYNCCFPGAVKSAYNKLFDSFYNTDTIKEVIILQEDWRNISNETKSKWIRLFKSFNMNTINIQFDNKTDLPKESSYIKPFEFDKFKAESFKTDSTIKLRSIQEFMKEKECKKTIEISSSFEERLKNLEEIVAELVKNKSKVFVEGRKINISVDFE